MLAFVPPSPSMSCPPSGAQAFSSTVGSVTPANAPPVHERHTHRAVLSCCVTHLRCAMCYWQTSSHAAALTVHVTAPVPAELCLNVCTKRLTCRSFCSFLVCVPQALPHPVGNGSQAVALAGPVKAPGSGAAAGSGALQAFGLRRIGLLELPIRSSRVR